MNIKEKIQEENARHTRAIEFYALLESDYSDIVHHIDFVDVINKTKTIDIYTKNFTYSGFFGVLREFSAKFGKYRIDHYDMSCSRLLCVRYLFEDSNKRVLMFCAEPEKLLEKISNGKCKIAENTFNLKSVVCDL
jgi:hypothetical protein